MSVSAFLYDPNDLKKFQCHKQVYALPMDLYTYNERRHLPTAEQTPNREGYLVVYNRGEEREYVSWSPKDVFDEGYNEIAETSGE